MFQHKCITDLSIDCGIKTGEQSANMSKFYRYYSSNIVIVQ